MKSDWLKAYKEADKLVLEVFDLLKSCPKKEKQGIGADILKSAVAVASNLLACQDFELDDCREFIDTASYSSSELLILLNIAKNLGYTNQVKSDLLIAKLEKIKKLIYKIMFKKGAPVLVKT